MVNPSPDPAVAERATAAENALFQELRDFRELQLPAVRQRCCAAIESYVDILRAGGEPPERVVVAVKELAHRAGMRTVSDRQFSGVQDVQELLMEDFVTCAIERYFHDAT